MAPLKLVSSARAKASVPLLTVTAPAMKPVAPPLPICNVPPLMIVPPQYVFVPVSTNVFVPCLTTLPGQPEMLPRKSRRWRGRRPACRR